MIILNFSYTFADLLIYLLTYRFIYLFIHFYFIFCSPQASEVLSSTSDLGLTLHVRVVSAKWFWKPVATFTHWWGSQWETFKRATFSPFLLTPTTLVHFQSGMHFETFCTLICRFVKATEIISLVLVVVHRCIRCSLLGYRYNYKMETTLRIFIMYTNTVKIFQMGHWQVSGVFLSFTAYRQGCFSQWWR